MIRNIARVAKATLFSKETLIAFLFLVGLISFEMTLLSVPFRHYFVNLQRREYAIGFGALLIVFVSWIWALFSVNGQGSRFSAAILLDWRPEREDSRN
jgi:hypothetical protein